MTLDPTSAPTWTVDSTPTDPTDTGGLVVVQNAGIYQAEDQDDQTTEGDPVKKRTWLRKYFRLSFIAPIVTFLASFNLAFFVLAIPLSAICGILKDYDDPGHVASWITTDMNMLWIIIACWLSVLLFKLSPMGTSVNGKKLIPWSFAEGTALYTPLLAEVETRARIREAGLPRKIKYYVRDEEGINAMAMGTRLAINRGTLDLCNQRTDGAQLFQGIAAHEFGHLANKDRFISALQGSVYFWVRAFTWLILLPLWAVAGILYGLGWVLIFIPYAGTFMGAGVSWLGSWLAKLLIVIVNWTSTLAHNLIHLIFLHGDRSAERSADRFAVDLGYRDGLIIFLRIAAAQEYEQSWWRRLQSTHPASIARLKRLLGPGEGLEYR